MTGFSGNTARRATRALSLACAAGGMGASSFALAQSQPPVPAAQTGTRVQAPDPSLIFSLNERFDSNIPRINESGVNPRGLVKRDIRLTPALDVVFGRNLGRHVVSVRSSVGYDFYIRNNELDSGRFLVQPTAYLDLPVCDLKVDMSVSRQQSDLGELVYFSADPSATTRNIETRKRAAGTLICGENYGLRPTFQVARDVGDNSNTFRRIADYRSTRLQPGLSYSSPALGTVSAYAVKVDTDLPFQPLGGSGVTGYRQTGYGLSYLRDIGRYLTFEGSVSHVDVEPEGGLLSRRSGANYDLALTLQTSEQLQFMARASRAFSSSLTSVSVYEIDQDYAVTVNYAASPRVRFSFGGSISPREFVYEKRPVGNFIGKQTQRAVFGIARTELGRRFRLSVGAGYDERDADNNIFDYKAFNTNVGLSFVY